MKLPSPSRLRIVLYPNPVLKKRAADVGKFNAEITALVKRMLELMREAKGVGLAAPQVGVGLRVFVCNPTGEPGDDLVCVNPRFTELSGGEEREEGCLSIPGVTVTMRRATQVAMEAFDVDGKPYKTTGTELRARIWQHEMDHLDGRLIVDNMSATDEIANRRAIKQLQDQYRPSRRT
jgi:peptide deformylase